MTTAPTPLRDYGYEPPGEPVSVAPPAARFKVQPFGSIKVMTDAAYLVHGIVPRIGLTLVYGPPKSGKSFWTFDLMMHVSLGWHYRDRRVQQGAVVYVLLEGTTGFRARVEAFRQAKLPDSHDVDVAFYLIAAPLALVADHAALIASIRQELPEIAIAAVVLDTVNRSFTGSESSDADMTAFVRATDVIRDAFDCAVILVHHSGLEGGRPRGHTALVGAVDAQIQIKRDAKDRVVATVDFMKDGDAGQDIVSALRVVEVGEDNDGEAITSLVVDPVDGPMPMRDRGKVTKLAKGARNALDALHDVLTDIGQEPPANPHIPSSVRCVTIDQWRDRAYRKGISTSDLPGSRGKAFDRATEALLAAKQVGIWEPYVWPVF